MSFSGGSGILYLVCGGSEPVYPRRAWMQRRINGGMDAAVTE
jgi:hypothetical protein